MIDAQASVSIEDITAQLGDIPQSHVILAINKTDIDAQRADAVAVEIAAALPHYTLVNISAKERTALDVLRDAILSIIEKQLPDSGQDIIVTNARHAQALRAAADSSQAVIQSLDSGIPADLIAQDLRETIHHLSSITGEITPTEVLGTIFSRFCIGK